MSVKRKYQKMKPITNKNIGKDLLKSGTHSSVQNSGIGKQERARRVRQANAGQLVYHEIKVTPRPTNAHYYMAQNRNNRGALRGKRS